MVICFTIPDSSLAQRWISFSIPFKGREEIKVYSWLPSSINKISRIYNIENVISSDSLPHGSKIPEIRFWEVVLLWLNFRQQSSPQMAQVTLKTIFRLFKYALLYILTVYIKIRYSWACFSTSYEVYRYLIWRIFRAWTRQASDCRPFFPVLRWKDGEEFNLALIEPLYWGFRSWDCSKMYANTTAVSIIYAC